MFLGSVTLLVASSKYAIQYIEELSKLLKISRFFLGFLLVGFATSLPELAISINAGLTGNGGLTAGNVVGANITDVLLVLGVFALLKEIKVKEKDLRENAEVLMGISLIPLLLLMKGSLGFLEGVLLFAVFGVYLIILRKNNPSIEVPKGEYSVREAVKVTALTAVTLGVLIISAGFVTNSAVELASIFGLSQSFIGLTILSISTTLPELTAGIQAIRKGYQDLAIGEILGSSIINITVVLGTAALLTDITFNQVVMGTAVFFLISANLLLWYTLQKFKVLGRKQGILFLTVYAFFLISEVIALQS